MLLLYGIHTDKNRLIQLKQSSGVQPDLSRDYNRASSVTEMLWSLEFDLLEYRRKAHPLNIFYLAVNISIALPIPIIFDLKSVLLDHFLMIHKPTAIMIITFIVSFQGQ